VAGTLRLQLPAGLSHPQRTFPADRLRLSVTDACNYACSFCHNEGALPTAISWRNQLTPEAMAFYVEAAAVAGITSIKLTGGEPLIYQHGDVSIVQAVDRLCDVASQRANISITTNGQLLSRHAHALSKTALSHVTVSIHTLDKEVFRRQISSSGSPVKQLQGICSAVSAGLQVKANVVVLPDTLEDVPRICHELFDAGVSVVRLYRTLWSPLNRASATEIRVSDYQLLEIACEATDLARTQSLLTYASAFLSSNESDLPRGLIIEGESGRVEIDRMPLPSASPSAVDEGDYALRISASGGLHSRLFGPTEELSQMAASHDLHGAVQKISFARRELTGKN
jgi:sulfatase maturation enzyme AslB (radical SAM superfamily)